jgi:hypothetical protein
MNIHYDVLHNQFGHMDNGDECDCSMATNVPGLGSSRAPLAYDGFVARAYVFGMIVAPEQRN